MTDEEKKKWTVITPHYVHYPVGENMWLEKTSAGTRFVDDKGNVLSGEKQGEREAPKVQIKQDGDDWITVWVDGVLLAHEHGGVWAGTLAKLFLAVGCKVERAT